MRQFLTLLAVLGAMVLAVRRRGRRRPGRLVILSPRRSTVIDHDGAVRSIQSAELTLPRSDLERLWTPENLENLARTYWRFLSRVTLGLIQVKYGPRDRRVVLLGTRLTLLRFDSPEYGLQETHGSVRWRIRDGLLVARAGRGKGYLALDVWSGGPVGEDRCKLRIEVGVTNFYSAIATAFSTPVYKATQSVIHVLVTHSFLRSLARLELARSRVGRLASVGGRSATAAALAGESVEA